MVTLVTAFYDLTKYDGVIPGRRTAETYLELAKRKTLTIPYKMVIYSDTDYIDKIKTIREQVSDAPTEYITKPMHEWEYYKQIDQIKESMTKGRSAALRKKLHWKISPGYSVCVCSKWACLKDTIDRNPYESTHFLWIDFGMGYLLDSNPKFGQHFAEFISNPSDKIKITQRWYVDEKIINTPEFIQNGFAFAAGVFGGAKANLLEMKQLFDERRNTDLKQGLALVEEHLFAKLYVEYPDKFDLSYGDYYHILDNLYKPRMGFSYIVNEFIIKQSGLNMERARKVADQLWEIRDTIGLSTRCLFETHYLRIAPDKSQEILDDLLRCIDKCTDLNMINHIRRMINHIPPVMCERDNKITYISKDLKTVSLNGVKCDKEYSSLLEILQDNPFNTVKFAWTDLTVPNVEDRIIVVEYEYGNIKFDVNICGGWDNMLFVAKYATGFEETRQMACELYLLDKDRFNIIYSMEKGIRHIVDNSMCKAGKVGNHAAAQMCGMALWGIRDQMTRMDLFYFLRHFLGVLSYNNSSLLKEAATLLNTIGKNIPIERSVAGSILPYMKTAGIDYKPKLK